jgi:hypothetical protein
MKNLSIIILFMLILAACYPDGPDYVEDLDVVYTTHDQEYDFDAKTTFAMPDVIVIGVELTEGDTVLEFMNPLYSTPILEAIQQNMETYGWTRVDVDENPDLLLTPGGVSSTTYYYSYWYDWWYGGYWGWYGWYYPPYYTVSSYTTGTLLLVLADPKQASDSPINRSPALWLAAANGLLTYGYDLSRVSHGINQAFSQSEYLDIK